MRSTASHPAGISAVGPAKTIRAVLGRHRAVLDDPDARAVGRESCKPQVKPYRVEQHGGPRWTE